MALTDPGIPGEFVVLANGHGQHSIWPAALDVPSGWHPCSPVLPEDECLAAAERSWTDMTPAAPAHPAGRARDGQLAHELFAAQAAQQPRATAIMSGRERLTYGELDESATRLARQLSAAGVGPETVAGVHLERGAGLIRALLAIMKAGGGYLPLDPSLPAARLAQACAQVNPVAVLTSGASPFPSGGARLLRLEELDAAPADGPGAGGARPHPGNLCYVISTSGSTGAPKAVAVSYGSLAAVLADVAREYQIGPEDRVAQLADMSFDTSLEQVFTALTTGATLVLPPPGPVVPTDLLRGIQRVRVTVADLTPAYWHRLLALTEPADERLRSVRLMITGGERADLADCLAARRAAPWARLLNAYGLTETTITSTLCDVGAWLPGASPEAIVPAGRAVGPARVMVLDGMLRPVPAGAAGEVYIGGRVVARGYLGRPGLTAQRFLPDPGGVPGSRMYRTGDLGRWRPDGRLEVTGRIDRQLKVSGFRVEPGEIEAVLAAHPGVAEVSVRASESALGAAQLVAYYTPRTGAASPPEAAGLRRYLAERLPGYMIPAAFVARGPASALRPGPPRPAPARPGPARPATQAPGKRLTPAQAALAALWARLLERGDIGLDDDFFALGGNSLLAAEMLAHARALLAIPADAVAPLTRRLLRDPTLRGFAAAAADASAGQLSPEADLAETDFTADARLGVTVARPAAARRPGPGSSGDGRPGGGPREVLLTGATGFLGAYLLGELATATGDRIHCLVRAGDAAAARTRLGQAAARYELPPPPAGRVVPLAGDLAAPRLGLSERAFSDLARRVDVIYHVGASVNFIYPYQELHAANVAGTREVIRLAGESRGIPVHFVSTLAVLAGLGVAGTREVTEETPLGHPDLLRMGYVETKYVAEELLRNAGQAGLPVSIYRPMDIVGSLRTGAWSTATEMCALIRFIADSGLAPDIDLPLDLAAADTCAAAIRQLSDGRDAAGRTFHLAPPESPPLGVLTSRLRQHGYEIEEIPYEDWVIELARRSAREPGHPMAAFVPLFVNRGPAGLTVAEMYFRHVFPHYTRTNTEQGLRGTGIVFPPAGSQLIDRNIGRLIRTGYLPSPRAGQRQDHVA